PSQGRSRGSDSGRSRVTGYLRSLQIPFFSPARTRLFGCFAAAAGTFRSPAAAFAAVHVLSPECSTDHGPCAPDAALHFDCLYRAVESTCAALHAVPGMNEFSPVFSLAKNTVGADLRAAPAVDALFREITKRILRIGVKHQATPMRRRMPSTIPRKVPAPAMSTIAGTYRKISFFTPVRDVNVVEPVKLRARYAVTTGMIRSGTSTVTIRTMPDIPGFRAKVTANGIATIAPRMNPFVEKSRVGITGSRAGKSTVPERTATTAASAATGPARKYSAITAAIIGRRICTSSTGVRTRRSARVNRTVRISRVAVCVAR